MSTIFTVANGLSLLRILLTPIFVQLLLWGLSSHTGYRYVLGAFIVFTIAALTDTFDGYYARRNNSKTPLGAFLDPLADKILVLSAFGVFWHLSLVSSWVLIILIGRDAIMTITRMFLVCQKNALVTSQFARYKTCTQFIVLYALLLYALLHAYLPPLVLVSMYRITQGLTWLVACMSIATVLDYIRPLLRSILRHQPTP